jgi:hypothetical protein
MTYKLKDVSGKETVEISKEVMQILRRHIWIDVYEDDELKFCLKNMEK